MGKLIVVGNYKGGVGKTTLATNIAVMLAIEGGQVQLIDTDDSAGSSNHWSGDRDKFAEEDQGRAEVSVIVKTGEGFIGEVRRSLAKHDYVVIDAGGYHSLELEAALMVADLLIVPGIPSPPDIQTIALMNEKLLGRMRELNPELRTVVVANSAPFIVSQTDAADMHALLRPLPGLQVLNTVLVSRKAYRYAFSVGAAVVEMPDDKDNQKAKSEIRAFYQEVKEALYGDQAQDAA